jgi:hypothetical protein
MPSALTKFTTLFVTAVLGLNGSGGLYAQEAPKPKLQILIIGGEGSINNVKQRTAREPVVEVQDENRRPVAGAIILFKAPDFGASGTFPDGSTVLRVTTDEQGRATAQGFRPNTIEGSMDMQVTATFQDATASTVIHMRNAVVPGVAKAGGNGKIIAIVGAVAGAAAVGLAVGLRGGKGNSNPGVPVSATTISLGTGTVGPRP